MKWVLAEPQVNAVRYIADAKSMRYTYALEKAQKFSYSQAHKLAGAMCHYGFDFCCVSMEVADKMEGVWYG